MHKAQYLTLCVDNRDFEPFFATLTFESGDKNRSISVALINDNVVENSERFFVSISSSQVGVEVVPPQRTTVIIIDDDSQSNRTTIYLN